MSVSLRSPSRELALMRRLLLPCLAFAVSLPASAQETLLLRQPTVSEKQIAFAYAGNIWVVDRAGGESRRLTSYQGGASNPHLSPDGKTVAFTSTYGGNGDVYTVPTDGGEPKRLTWHPGADNVTGWTPDGKRVVFASGRQSHAPNAVPRFWSVSMDGGAEEAMSLPRAFQGMISPDGERVAYRMANSWDDERRNYRGGQNKPIWIVDLESYALDTIPRPINSKELDPVWVGSDVYFISDRDGVQNVYRFDPKGRATTQL
ncbi:MAG: protease, partial [Gemmatimonadaceae bacterium]